MLLLCRHQPSDISDDNSAVVNLKDMATATAGKSIIRQSQGENMNMNLLIIRFWIRSTLFPMFGKVATGLLTHSVRSSTYWLEEFPSSKATSVKSIEWYSPRLTGQERSVPFRIRHRRMLSRPHETILKPAHSQINPCIEKLEWDLYLSYCCSENIFFLFFFH